MKLPHWLYFLSLEKDFIKTIEYVEFDSSNELTFSIVYTKLYLSICSEVDVVAKLLCKKIFSTSNSSNINQYRSKIVDKYPNFHTVECLIPRYSLKLYPWASWSESKTPSWWKDYNNVTHERNLYSNLANQKNVRDSLCGLFCMLLYFYQSEFYIGDLVPIPNLLDYERMSGYMSINPGVVLPDIPK